MSATPACVSHARGPAPRPRRYRARRPRILAHIGDPTKAPVLSPARGPPAWDTFDQTPLFDPLAPPPEPTFEFDQRVTW